VVHCSPAREFAPPDLAPYCPPVKDRRETASVGGGDHRRYRALIAPVLDEVVIIVSKKRLRHDVRWNRIPTRSECRIRPFIRRRTRGKPGKFRRFPLAMAPVKCARSIAVETKAAALLGFERADAAKLAL